jgi:hypothetical protein
LLAGYKYGHMVVTADNLCLQVIVVRLSVVMTILRDQFVELIYTCCEGVFYVYEFIIPFSDPPAYSCSNDRVLAFLLNLLKLRNKPLKSNAFVSISVYDR